MKKILTIAAVLFVFVPALSQKTFESDPTKAEFVTSDIPRFWEAFDKMDESLDPFEIYLAEGSKGLKDFIRYRIESSENLLKVAIERREDYESKRAGSYKIDSQREKIIESYKNFKKIYPQATFPPTYFVIGAFNSGGTSSKNGLIIGVEMQSNIDNIPYIVAHELIHFNQKDVRRPTLLSQSISEGSADFIGEMISGKHINETAFEYGNKHKEELCKEFVQIMDSNEYNGWLYGSNGKKEGRPNDLGYWIGYQITKAYYDKAEDKDQAIVEILDAGNSEMILEKSGYLDEYLR